jgi:hypothetical protein
MNHRGVHQSSGAGLAAPGQVRPQLSQARPNHGQTQLATTARSQARASRWPHLSKARPDRPLGAPAPTKCHVSGPRHQQSHEQVLDGQETLILCRLDQKAKIGSTWIDGPTLNCHNRHQGVILDVPQHRRCITQ